MSYTRTLELISQVLTRQFKDPNFTVNIEYQDYPTSSRVVENVRVEHAHDTRRNSLLMVTMATVTSVQSTAFLGLEQIKAFVIDGVRFSVDSDDSETVPAPSTESVGERLTALSNLVDVYVTFNYTAHDPVEPVEGWLVRTGPAISGSLFVILETEDSSEKTFYVNYITDLATSEDIDAPAGFDAVAAEQFSVKDVSPKTDPHYELWGKPGAGKAFEAMGRAADLAFRGEKVIFMDELSSLSPFDQEAFLSTTLETDTDETEDEVSVIDTLTNVDGDVEASFSYTTARGNRKSITGLTPAFVRPSERHDGQSILVGFLKQENGRYVRKTFRTDRITDLVLSTS
jgi:hypothetical protein